MNWLASLSWRDSLLLLCALVIVICAAICAFEKRAKCRRRSALDRLNSPFFRCVTDPYYRAIK